MSGFFGAIPSHDGVTFTVWAPRTRELQLVLHDGPAAGAHPLARHAEGIMETWVRASPDDETIVIRRTDDDTTFWIVARFKSGGTSTTPRSGFSGLGPSY